MLPILLHHRSLGLVRRSPAGAVATVLARTALVRISYRPGADVAQAVQPAVSRVVSTLVDARDTLLWPEKSPRLATQSAVQSARPLFKGGSFDAV